MSHVTNIFQQFIYEEKKMSKKYHIQERAFLNKKPEMRAYIIAVVEDTRDLPLCCDEHRKGGEIVFEIASCYDEIYLHFDMATADDRENSLYKANKLAEVVNTFRQANRKRGVRY